MNDETRSGITIRENGPVRTTIHVIVVATFFIVATTAATVAAWAKLSERVSSLEGERIKTEERFNADEAARVADHDILLRIDENVQELRETRRRTAPMPPAQHTTFNNEEDAP